MSRRTRRLAVVAVGLSFLAGGAASAAAPPTLTAGAIETKAKAEV